MTQFKRVMDLLVEVSAGGPVSSVEMAKLQRADGRRLPPSTPAAASDLMDLGWAEWRGNGLALTEDGHREALAEGRRRAHGGG